ncbi:MFS transporter [Deinococcus pimensis]|uniref:MFS transporter n=1 Tax=Deinococcus pimensis TaxID=309888 RepID=UPI0004B307EE|nr:MFS transporter [Deinococcus pimensis]
MKHPEPHPNVDTTEHLVRRTMRLSVLEGVPAMGFIVWTGGSVLTGYALYLHATPAQLGLLGGMPLVAQALTPLIAYLAGRAGRRKPLALLTAGVGRGLWILAPLILLLPEHLRLWALLALIGLSNVFIAANGTLWFSWMGDVVPEKQRGRYFGFRGGLHGMIGMLCALLGGLALDHLPSPLKFQVMLTAAVVCGLLAVVLLSLHWEPPHATERLGLRETLTAPLHDRNFRRFIVLQAYWALAWNLAAPFMLPYFYGELHLHFTQGAIYSALVATLGMVLMPQWGRVADRVGHKPVFTIAAVGAGSALPLVWTLAAPGQPWIVWVSALFDATAAGAGGAALANLALANAPRERRSAYMAVMGVATGVVGFLAATIGGQIIAHVGTQGVNLGPVHLTGYHLVFLVAALLRTQVWRFVRTFEELGAWRARDVLRPRALGGRLSRDVSSPTK